MTMTTETMEKEIPHTVEVLGLAVELLFAPQANNEIPDIVLEVLKNSYVRRQSA